MEEKRLAIREDRQVALQELETRFALAVRQRELLESYIRERLKPDKHFYTVGDELGRKPSLTKEGAELICLPHALKGHYHWLAGPESPPLDDSPYQITMKCELEANGKFAGDGVGSASSMVTKKDGTRVQRQKDPGLRHNATLKMACKSAYIAATLNSTAASEFFTQDLEDDQTGGIGKPESDGHWCSIHKTNFFMRGKMKSFAHPIGDTNEWCHEHKDKESPPQQPQPIALESKPELVEGEASSVTPELDFNPDEIKDMLRTVKWSDMTVKSYLKNLYHVATEGTVIDVIARLSKEDRILFMKELADRMAMAK